MAYCGTVIRNGEGEQLLIWNVTEELLCDLNFYFKKYVSREREVM